MPDPRLDRLWLAMADLCNKRLRAGAKEMAASRRLESTTDRNRTESEGDAHKRGVSSLVHAKSWRFVEDPAD